MICAVRFLLAWLSLLAGTGVIMPAYADTPVPFAAGVDISELQTLQDNGALYRENGTVQSPYQIFRDAGINWMRVRLFVDPNGVGPLVNDLPYTIRLARTIKQQGFSLLLDIHYSDSWADPHQQHTPKRWRRLPHDLLVTTVRAYTRDVISQLAANGACPDMVEIGNEITNGLLWPDGRVTPRSDDAAAWQRVADLLGAGIAGVREASAQTRIMIHIDRGGDLEASRSFYRHILDDGVRFDVIGLSDYPWWQGSLAELANNLASLTKLFGKPVIVVETAFPWAAQRIGVKGQTYTERETEAKVLHYPATPEGQAAYMRALIQVVKAAPDHLGVGVFYWAAAWVNNASWGAPGWSRDWEQRALFDAEDNSLPALSVLGAATASRDAKQPATKQDNGRSAGH